MPSKDAVTLVSYRKTHNTVVVNPGETKRRVGVHHEDSSLPVLALRNRSGTVKEFPRLQPPRCMNLTSSTDSDNLSLPLSQPDSSDAGCKNYHGNKPVTRSNQDDLPDVSCEEVVSNVKIQIGDSRVSLCERSDSEVHNANIALTDKELTCERCDVGLEGEIMTDKRVDDEVSSQCESGEDDTDSVHKNDVDVVFSSDNDTAVTTDDGRDTDSEKDDTVSHREADAEGVRQAERVSLADLHFIDENESVHNDSDSRVDDVVSGVKEDTAHAVADTAGNNHLNDTSTNTRNSDTLDDQWLNHWSSQPSHAQPSHDLSSSVSRADSDSSREHTSTPRPRRRRRSPVKLDLHHGLQSEWADYSDDDDDDDDDNGYHREPLVSPFPISQFVDDDDDDDDDYYDRTSLSLTMSEPDVTPPFAVGELRHAECSICLETRSLHVRACCTYAACDDCLERHYATQVGAACIRVRCVGCDAYVPRDEIIFRLDDDAKRQFDRFLVDANRDPCVKTCPRCSVTTRVDADKLLGHPEGVRVTCADCHLDWCFPCQAPWHEDATCRQYRKGDKELKTWARQQQRGQANAQKCPRCKVS